MMNLEIIIIITISICIFLIIGIILFLISNTSNQRKNIFRNQKNNSNLNVEEQYLIIKEQKRIIINLKIELFYFKCLYYIRRIFKCH